MNSIIVFLSLGFITIIGYIMLKLFEVFPKKQELLTISYGFGLGVGIIYLQFFFYSHLGIWWSRETIVFPWVLFFLFLFFWQRNVFHFLLPRSFSLTLLQKILLLGILLTVFYVLFEALLRPVSVWDGWASWLFKSKVFFSDGKISPESLLYISPDYPLVISLVGTYIYSMVGFVDDTSVLVFSSAFYIFTSFILFSVLKKEYGSTYALLGTFLWVTIQNVIRHGGRMEAGLADLPLGYYMFSSTLLLIDYYKSNSGKILVLLSAFLGIAGLIKVEGVPFTICMILLISFHIWRKKLYQHIWILLLWLLPLIHWNGFKWWNGLSYNEGHRFFLPKENFFSFGGGILARIFQELINIKTWNLLWITYIFVLLFYIRTFSKRLILITLIMLFQMSVYLFMYFFMSGFGPESSIERLLIHIVPLALYTILIQFHQEFIKKQLN